MFKIIIVEPDSISWVRVVINKLVKGLKEKVSLQVYNVPREFIIKTYKDTNNVLIRNERNYKFSEKPFCIN